jgi:ubiquinone/menaquinone biosynthesis C-methylase UbiE
MVAQSGTEIGRFGAVDSTDAPEQFIRWLDWAEQLPQSVALRSRSHELLGVAPGTRALDIGCGTGKAVSELSARGALAAGVDASEAMIAAARGRHPGLDFRVGLADSLPAPGGSVRGVRAERLLQHLSDPAAAAREGWRVLEPGGTFVVVDQDYDTWALDSEDPELTRAIQRALADSIAGRWVGRRLRALLLDGGFSDVSVEVQTAVHTERAAVAPALASFAQIAVAAAAVSQAEADAWLAGLARLGERGRFFCALPFFLARGVKAPAPAADQRR